MDNKYLNKMLSEMDKDLAAKGMNRRDALKLAGLSSAGFLMGGATNAQASEEEIVKTDAKGRILIVGGGLAGMSTARRLTSQLSDPDITVIEPEELSVSYQPGQTLIAAGLWD